MVHLADRTTVDVPAADVALVPTGSTEQHGPALPLGTDTTIATALAEAAHERRDVVVTPAVPVGVSAHHRHFEGTLWVADATFERYVGELLRGLAGHGFERVVLVNGHGGNVPALKRVGQRLRADAVAYPVVWNWWEATADLVERHFDADGGHAGHVETSVMLAVAEALVHPDRLEAAEEGVPPGWGRTVHGGDVGFDTVDFTPTGAVGRPTDADAEVGEAIVDAATAELVALVDWLEGRPRSALFEHARPLFPDR